MRLVYTHLPHEANLFHPSRPFSIHPVRPLFGGSCSVSIGGRCLGTLRSSSEYCQVAPRNSMKPVFLLSRGLSADRPARRRNGLALKPSKKGCAAHDRNYKWIRGLHYRFTLTEKTIMAGTTRHTSLLHLRESRRVVGIAFPSVLHFKLLPVTDSNLSNEILRHWLKFYVR